MKFRSIFHLFKESLLNLSRNGWMTFASVGAVTVTLLMLGVFMISMTNAADISKQVEKSVEIRIHIEQVANDKQVKALEKDIKSLSEIASLTFVTKEEELENHKSALGEELFKFYEQENPLRDIFVVKLKDPLKTTEVVQKIEKFQNVYKVNYGEGYVEKLFKFTGWIRWAGTALIIGLTFVAVFLIANTIRITIISRRKEIEIMRLVGATNAYIRFPFFLEGIWLGILGSIIPIAILSSAYYYVYSKNIFEKLFVGLVSMIPPNPFLIHIALAIIAIGSIIGVLASLLSMRKYVKL